jgi:uncharacterized protein (TIGR01319 family)
VLSNAAAVAAAGTGAAVVVACNADVARDAAREFEATDHETVVVDNVLPAVDREHSDSARSAIREIFIRRVVRAKGISSAHAFFDSVLMPSPAAVLACAELIAAGADGIRGTGGVAVVDVGGATTDVHSVVHASVDDGLVRRASPPPSPSARTVEGDLGVRWNADAVLALDRRWLAEHLGLDGDALTTAARRRSTQPGYVPASADERRVDLAFATSCVAIAMERHVGRLSTSYVPGEGAEVTLEGRDLREVPALIVTGGSMIAAGDAATEATTRALSRLDHVHPAPRAARLLVDRRYILAAAGLLSTIDSAAALRLLQAQVPGLLEVMSV